jgi:hypothetical protein
MIVVNDEIETRGLFNDILQTTRRYIPEDNTLHNRRCENPKSYIL